jgi:hypothetical protein
VSVEAYLTAADVTGLTGRIPVKIQSQLFQIAKVDGFDPTQVGLTKLVLYKV